MKKYYIHTSAQLNGRHEVHHEYCIYLPKEDHRIYLGIFDSCRQAMKASQKYYPSVTGCKTCARDCRDQ